MTGTETLLAAPFLSQCAPSQYGCWPLPAPSSSAFVLLLSFPVESASKPFMLLMIATDSCPHVSCHSHNRPCLGRCPAVAAAAHSGLARLVAGSLSVCSFRLSSSHGFSCHLAESSGHKQSRALNSYGRWAACLLSQVWTRVLAITLPDKDAHSSCPQLAAAMLDSFCWVRVECCT